MAEPDQTSARAAGGGVDDPVVQEAGRWIVRQGGGAMDDGEDASFRAWYRADPAHARAYDTLERLWQQLDRVDRKRLGPGPRVGRKLGTLAALVACMAFLTLLGPSAALEWGADHVAGIGSPLTVTLADGSTVILEGGSAIKVRLAGTRREVELLRGRAMFEVRSGAATGLAPFVVVTDAATATALGTRYEVERTERGMWVAVHESRVVVDCTVCSPAAKLTLGAGEAAEVRGLVLLDRLALPAGSGSWTRGMLSFDDVSVGEVAERLSRYTHKTVVVLGEDTRRRRVSAVVDGRDAEAALHALAAGNAFRVTSLPGLILVR